MTDWPPSNSSLEKPLKSAISAHIYSLNYDKSTTENNIKYDKMTTGYILASN